MFRKKHIARKRLRATITLINLYFLEQTYKFLLTLFMRQGRFGQLIAPNYLQSTCFDTLENLLIPIYWSFFVRNDRKACVRLIQLANKFKCSKLKFQTMFLLFWRQHTVIWLCLERGKLRHKFPRTLY